MFVEFFIKRPVLSIVCSIIITLAGVLVIDGLPIAQYPDLASPTVTVRAMYVGASADVVESAVTIPLEQELNGVEGMRYISSRSSNDGSSQITITFAPDFNIDIAAVDVQNRVARAAPRLPAQVNQAGITIDKASAQQLLTLGLVSEDGRYDTLFLSNYAEVYLKDALKRVPGVADVRIYGERKFSMRIWLDPTKLAARNLTSQDVVRALQAQNIQVAAGQVGQPPTDGEQLYQIPIRAQGRLVEPEEFEEVVVHRGDSGRVVRVKDVARVELGAESYNNMMRFNGRQSVGLGIFQLMNANALDVRDGVVRELERLKPTFPPGLDYELANDTTRAVRASIEEVIKTLFEAITLVILVIFLFLHGWRSVLITAFTLPVSLLGTFTFVKLFGFSINTLTLFGLTLATGIVVDDAIVVIENIERLMTTRKLSALEAAKEGMREITGAVIAITIALVAVFLPVALFPGTTGAIYRQFALTIAASVGLSAFCALTLTPALCAKMLKHGGEKWLLFRRIDDLLDWLRAFYGRWLRVLLRYPVAILVVFVLLLGGTIWLFRTVPQGFIPAEDNGNIIVMIQGPDGSSFDQTNKVLGEAIEILHQQPEVGQTFAVAGFSFQGNGPNMGIMFITLHPWDERKDPSQSAAAVVERLRGPLGAIKGARVIPVLPPTIRGVGSLGGFQFMVQDRAGGRSLDELAEATQELIARANADPRLRGVYTSFTANTPILNVEVDRLKAEAMGVSLQDVYSTLQLNLGSLYVNDFDFANRTYRVYVQAEGQYRDAPEDIGSFYVRNDQGEMVPLESLVRVSPTTSASVIAHYNLFRTAELNGGGAPGVSDGDVLLAMEELAREVLPAGVDGEWTGISLEQKEAGGQTLAIFALGILFVFLILSAQYESFILPFVIILSVPLAVLGALGLQVLRGIPNDVFGQVGLVMLVGLSSKNAILIVEFAEQLREQGKSALDAVIEAGELRLRPILMTSIAFLLGVVPLMLASGAGANARISLGTTVFGGMLFSTVVNLLFIPGLYLLVRMRSSPHGRAPKEEAGASTQS